MVELNGKCPEESDNEMRGVADELRSMLVRAGIRLLVDLTDLTDYNIRLRDVPWRLHEIAGDCSDLARLFAEKLAGVQGGADGVVFQKLMAVRKALPFLRRSSESK